LPTLGLLLAIDKQARELLKLIKLEIQGLFKMLTGKINDNGDNSAKNSQVATEN
jgi:hypothetical protein